MRREPVASVKLCVTIHDANDGLATLRGAARLLARDGYWGIEPDIVDPRTIDVAALRKIVSDHGLRISAIATGRGHRLDGLSLSHPDPTTRRDAVDRIRRHIDMARELQTHVIIGLMRGVRDANDPEADCLGRLIDSLRACGEHAAEAGCLLFYEAINRKETNISNTANQAAELIGRCGQTALRLLLDTYHMDIEGEPPSETIGKHAALLGHFHLADRDRQAPGTAGIDFPPIMNTLADLGYNGAITVEVPLRPDMPTGLARIKESLVHLGIASAGLLDRV